MSPKVQRLRELVEKLVNKTGDDEGNVPWQAREDYNTGCINLITDADGTTLANTWASDEPKETADLIVAAVNALPALLDLIDAAQRCAVSCELSAPLVDLQEALYRLEAVDG